MSDPRVAAAARRFGLLPAQVEPVLRRLESEGRLLRGELRPGGRELEWCDREVLRRLKRRTLSRLRDDVAPVGPLASERGAAAVAFDGVWFRYRGDEDDAGARAAVDVSRIQPKLTLAELRQPFLDRIEKALYKDPF